MVSLCATLFARVFSGPLVDRQCNSGFDLSVSHPLLGYGPRKIMAWLLIVGAIPSGLAGTAHTAIGLYFVRFFIGILGGTFVPCLAWTTAFFDKNVVGTGNSAASTYLASF